MDRESYDQLVAQAKADAAATLGDHPTPARMQHALDVLAQRVAAVTRDFHLANLMGVEELAARLGTTDSAVRYLLSRRNQEAPVGRRVGKNTWLVDIDELPVLEQDRRRKASNHAPHP